MKRHYFISDDLDDLAAIESELDAVRISAPRVHVLSNDHAGLALRQLSQVEAVLKKDVVHGTELGAVVGVACAIAILLLFWMSGLTESYTWLPPIFLSIVILGFCTWEGGLIGIQEPHVDFRRFEQELRSGKHILLLDVEADQESKMRHIIRAHARIENAGEGESTPGWVIGARQKWSRFMELAP